jgi:uncharacterized protein YkwD
MRMRSLKLVLFVLVAAGFVSDLVAQKKRVSAPSSKTGASSKSTAAPTISTAASTTTSSSDPALKFLSLQEKQILDEINFARAKPSEYLKLLLEFRGNYKGREIHFPDGRILVTNEGVAALDDAINFLRTVKPAPPLAVREGMIQAARVHATDLVSNNRSGHQGSDGSKPQDRFSRYGTWNNTVGENIVYDSRNSRNDIILMLIDDGTANRGHRKNLFKVDFGVIGIATGKRPDASAVSVITFAGGFSEKGNFKNATVPQKY